MKIAILSDSHDHIWNLEKAISQFKDKEMERIIHCGDIVAGFSVKIIASADLPTNIVLGNNDEDHICMYKNGSDKIEWTYLGQEFGELEIDGRKLAYCHYPKLGSLLAKNGEYDAVFYGHTHQTFKELVGKTLLLNPGAVCGILNGKATTASYAVYDTKTNSAEIIEIR